MKLKFYSLIWIHIVIKRQSEWHIFCDICSHCWNVGLRVIFLIKSQIVQTSDIRLLTSLPPVSYLRSLFFIMLSGHPHIRQTIHFVFIGSGLAPHKSSYCRAPFPLIVTVFAVMSRMNINSYILFVCLAEWINQRVWLVSFLESNHAFMRLFVLDIDVLLLCL